MSQRGPEPRDTVEQLRNTIDSWGPTRIRIDEYTYEAWRRLDELAPEVPPESAAAESLQEA